MLVQAGGPVQGARQAGMGTAFVAVADDLSAIAINPAGLVQSSDTLVYAGATAIMLKTTYQSPTGDSEHTQAQTFYAPNLFIASDIGRSDLAIGVGFFSLYGIGGRKWDESGMTRYLSTESTIGTMVANPTVAWRICPAVSIGLGVDYLYAQNSAERMVDQSAAGGTDGKLTFDADGTGWGYNAGLMITPADGFRIGLAYRSMIRVDQKGSAEINNIAPPLQPFFGGASFKTDFETQLDFPERLTMGMALKASKRLMISTEVEWIRWSRFDRQDVDFDTEVPAAGFTDLSVDLNWNDIWLLKIGGEYALSDRFVLRAGYAFVQSPAPEETLSPSSPDADSHNISLGASYRIGKIVLDLFYMAAFFESIEVDNDVLDGAYCNFGHYMGAGLGYRF
jgi:long-chain fatty acid transport protein